MSPDRCRRGEPLIISAVSFAAYMLVARWAILGHNLVMGDAIARLANASYVIRGLDPHLAAIGYVWNPLPSLMEIPILELRSFWHVLINPGLAASVGSALCAAATLGILDAVLRTWGCGPRLRLAIVAVVGLNPMMIFYAVNGMSETYFMPWLVLAVGGLASWLRTGRNWSLVACAIGLGVGYLVRYEALGAAAGASLVVARHTIRRRRAHQEPWGWSVTARSVLLLLPTFVAFTGFALVSWLIAGRPFEQLQSQYGTSNQVSQYSAHPIDAAFLVHRGLTDLAQLCGMAPLALPLIVVAVLMRRRVSTNSWAAIAVLGGELVFSLALQLDNKVPFQWFRYWIDALPLEALMLADLARQLQLARTARRLVAGRDPVSVRQSRGTALLRGARGVLVALCIPVVLLATAGPTWAAMNDPLVGNQETQIAAALSTSVRESSAADRGTLRNFDTERRVAAYLDSMHLGRGQVLVDTLFAYPIVLASTNPDQFTIPADSDFAAALANPWATGIRYLLLNSATQAGTPDALNQRFPGVYGNGGNIGVLLLAADSDSGNVSWRLYQLEPPAD